MDDLLEYDDFEASSLCSVIRSATITSDCLHIYTVVSGILHTSPEDRAILSRETGRPPVAFGQGDGVLVDFKTLVHWKALYYFQRSSSLPQTSASLSNVYSHISESPCCVSRLVCNSEKLWTLVPRPYCTVATQDIFRSCCRKRPQIWTSLSFCVIACVSFIVRQEPHEVIFRHGLA